MEPRFCVEPDEIVESARREFGIHADRARLESALAAPLQTFEGQELFPEIHEKAAALFRSMIKDHPFPDGNKRMAIRTTLRFIAARGMKIREDEEVTIRLLALLVASDVQFRDEEMDYLKEWFRKHLVQRPGRPPRIKE
jgi:death-on-curing protein